MTSVRIIDEGGQVACDHRNKSCCDDCFQATPGLIYVGGEVYLWHRGIGWPLKERIIATRGRDPELRVSPRTVTVMPECHT